MIYTPPWIGYFFKVKVIIKPSKKLKLEGSLVTQVTSRQVVGLNSGAHKNFSRKSMITFLSNLLKICEWVLNGIVNLLLHVADVS